MILLLYHSYGKGNVHNFRQYFFDELVRSGAIAHDIALRENRHERDFNTIVAKACGGVIPDVVILFTIRKCGEISGLENFKGLVVLYECDSENYRPKVIDYLNKYKNIRLATFEFYPEMSYPYEVEHKLWLPPTITAEDKMLGLERIYDFGHWVIMQKARRYPTKGLRPLVSVRFQGLFTPLLAVLFTFPSRYSALSVARRI